MTEMTYRRLGASGLEVSVVGIGCNNFGGRMDAGEVQVVVDAALDAGINLFDTSDSYGNGASEELLGRAIKGRRDEVVVATKFASPLGTQPNNRGGGSRTYVMRAVEASLRRLGVDHIDLYQIHRPDPITPIEETLEALDDCVRAGKVRYLGNSNFAGWQIADADWVARSRNLHRFVSAQNNYSLLDRGVEAEVIPACERFGLGMLPFFPLASGMLTGKYRRGEAPPEGSRLASWPGDRAGRFMNDANFDVVEALDKVADDAGVSILHLAMGGLAAQPTVSSVIAGAVTAEQVVANAAAGTWVPDADTLAAINVAAPQIAG